MGDRLSIITLVVVIPFRDHAMPLCRHSYLLPCTVLDPLVSRTKPGISPVILPHVVIMVTNVSLSKHLCLILYLLSRSFPPSLPLPPRYDI